MTTVTVSWTKPSCCCRMFLSSGITVIKGRYERQFVIALPGIRCNGWGQHKGEEQWLIWNEWALDTASSWHRHEEQGLWSGAIGCLNLHQLSTDMSGQGQSGAWLCLILAETRRTRTVVRGIRYLTLPQPGIIQSTVFISMSYTLHTSVPVDRNSEFSKHWRLILPQHSWLLQDCIAFTQYGSCKTYTANRHVTYNSNRCSVKRLMHVFLSVLFNIIKY
jgi:hypothetical protein